MTNFKIGDKIRAVKGSDTRPYIIVGEVYEVTEIHSCGSRCGDCNGPSIQVRLPDNTLGATCYCEFELAEQEGQVEKIRVGDRVRCIKAYMGKSNVVGKEGRVIEMYPWNEQGQLTAVEFDEDIGGHRGCGNVSGKDGHVYNFQNGEQYLVRVSFREGDKIRFIGDPKNHHRSSADEDDLKKGDIVDYSKSMTYGRRNWGYNVDEFELVGSTKIEPPKIVIPKGAIKREELKYGMSVVYRGKQGWVVRIKGASASLKNDAGTWGITAKADGYWGEDGSSGWLLKGTAEPKVAPEEKPNYVLEKARIGDEVMYVADTDTGGHRDFLGKKGVVTDIQRRSVLLDGAEWYNLAELYLIKEGPKPVYPKRALKKNQVKVGMFVEGAGKKVGAITAVEQERLHIRIAEGSGWVCGLRYDGYWGARDSIGFLLKTSKSYVPVKFADKTKYSVNQYSCSEMDAIALGERTGKVLKVDKGTYRFLEEGLKRIASGSSDSRAVMHLLGKKDKVDTAIVLENAGGCQDTPFVEAEKVAQGMNTLATTGRTPVGFSISRIRSTRYHGGDTLVNNLKQWQVWFPNMYVLLLAKDGGRYAWYLGEKGIDKAEIKVGRKFIVNAKPIQVSGVLPIGTRVVYYKDVSSYGDNDGTPLWGGTQGKVGGGVVKSDSVGVHVKWDNGRTNGRFAYDTIALE